MPHAQGPGDKEEEVAFADSCLALAEATFQLSCFGIEKTGIPWYTRYTHKEILQANVFLGLFTTKCFLPVFATIARFEEKKASKRSLPK